MTGGLLGLGTHTLQVGEDVLMRMDWRRPGAGVREFEVESSPVGSVVAAQIEAYPPGVGWVWRTEWEGDVLSVLASGLELLPVVADHGGLVLDGFDAAQWLWLSDDYPDRDQAVRNITRARSAAAAMSMLRRAVEDARAGAVDPDDEHGSRRGGGYL